MTINKLLYYSFIGVFFFLPIATAPGIILGVAGLCLWTFSGLFWKERRKWIYQPWFIPTIVLLLLPWIGLSYTENIHYGLKIAQKSYLWLCAFAIASISYSKKETPDNFIIAFLAGLSVTAVVSLLQTVDMLKRIMIYLPLHQEFPVAFLDLTGHITLSLFLVLGILLLSFYFRRTLSTKLRILIFAGLGLFILDLLLVKGRTGYLAFLLLSPLFFYNLFGRKRWLIVCGLTLIAIIFIILAPPVQNRIQEVVNEVKQFQAGNPETSIGVRLYIWQGAWKILGAHPILGVGTGDFGLEISKLQTAKILPPLSVEVTQTFNTFLNYAISYGIYSLLFLIWLIWLLIKKGMRHRNQILGFFILVYSIIFIIGSFTDTLLIRHHTLYLFTLIIGLQSVLNQAPNYEKT